MYFNATNLHFSIEFIKFNLHFSVFRCSPWRQEARFASKMHLLRASRPLTSAFLYGIALVESAGGATGAFSAEIALVESLKAPDESVFGLMRSCRG